MIFSEFLVQKGLIKKSDLLPVLLDQVKQTPSVLEILFDANILDHDQIFSIYCCQIEENISTVEAMKSLNLWSKNTEKKIQEYLDSKRPSLSFLLISKNKITHESLFSTLDDFSHDSLSQKKIKKDILIEPKMQDQNKEEEKRDSEKIRNEHYQMFPFIDKNMIKNLSEEIENSSFFHAKESRKDLTQEIVLKELNDCFTSAKFIRASLLENLLRAIYGGINRCNINDKTRALCAVSLHLINESITYLKETLTEESFWKKHQMEYLDLLKKWQDVG